MTDFLHHEALNQLIEYKGWWFDASEAHGILTGLISSNQTDHTHRLLFPKDSSDDIAERTVAALNEHIEQTLADDRLRFNLMLPESGNTAERAEALSNWARGFGLAQAYLREQGLLKLDEAEQEALNDMIAFGELNADLSDDEENQQMLNVLEEHCRMTALMFYASTH